MNTIECILYIDPEDNNPLVTEGEIHELVKVKSIEKADHIDHALRFIEKGCLLDGKKCPEFIFLDLGKRSIKEKNFYDSLLKINEEITVKIQVVLLVDKENHHEVNELESLGIEYVIKPVNRTKLQSLFDRYFLLKNPII